MMTMVRTWTMTYGVQQMLSLKTRLEITLPIPFVSSSCEICLQQQRGNFILLNLNNALQQAQHHHRGADVLFSCGECRKVYKNKHSAQCRHVPKCKGPSVTEGGNVTCQICKQAFKTQRGLSQHERLVHPATRNEKWEQAAHAI